MREIKFRGRKINSTEWVCGDLRKTQNGNAGISVNGKLHIVDSETVGQYTGLKDKNNQEIYEGDMILVFEWDRKYEVIFEKGMFKASGNTTFSLVTATNGELSCQVIGNIYKNQLLKGDGENEKSN
ncbi:YopX family protein [Bacillus pseudomycoides]|uniref:YopX family protein n=1 Tax=Bacillus pseudomycoides TaxID=64104 RepID=UPI0015CF7C5D|nr:YopX family protein [Bacillus pseudomycoides]